MILLIMQTTVSMYPSAISAETLNVDDAALTQQGNELAVKLQSLEAKINGTVINEVPQPLNQNSEIEMKFTFETQLTNPQIGDYFTFTLPETLIDWDNNFNGSQIAMGDIPGFKWETTNNVVKVTLTDVDAQIHSGLAQFTIQFHSGFDFTGAGESLEQNLTIPSATKGEETYKLTFLPKSSGEKVVEKKAVQTTAVIENGERYFEWEVWLNKAGTTLTNAKVKDSPIGEHKLDGAITVETYSVGLNGVASTPSSSEQIATMDKIVLNGTNAYKLKYRTKIIIPSNQQEGEQKFKNKIELIQDGKLLGESTTGEVKTTYGKAIEKGNRGTSTNYKTYWYLNYNFNQQAISKEAATITDTLTGPHDLNIGSIKVYEAVVNEDGSFKAKGSEVNNYTLTPTDGTAKQFTIQFNEPITKAYRIEYETMHPYDFYTFENTLIKNIVVTGTGATDDKWNTRSQEILKKSYKVDYDKQEITWTIQIKADNKEITDLTLTDSFSPETGKVGTHTLITDVAITNGTKTGVQIIDNDPTKGFIMSGVNIAKGKTATITYKTSYKIEETGQIEDNASYLNTATIDWKSNNVPFTLAKTSTYTPQKVTVNNGRKWGSFNYQTQELSWNVVVNANKRDIAGAVLVDTLGNGHLLKEESFEVYRYTRTSETDGTVGEKLDPSNYQVVVSEDKKSYTLTFATSLAASLNSVSYIVKYKTVDSDTILGVESTNKSAKGNSYTNSAVFTTKNDKAFTLPADAVNIHEYVANKLLTKSVSGNDSSNRDGVLTWTLDINRSNSSLKNVVVSDAPSERIILDKSSIKIRPYVVTETDIKGDGAWLSPVELGFKVEFSENGGFAINLGDLDRKGYQIQYKTQTIESSKDSNALQNDAKITFDDQDQLANNQQSDAAYKNSFAFSKSLAGFSLIKGAMKFEKVGLNIVTNEKVKLAGAKFELYLTDGKTLVRDHIVSDENGQFTISNLNYGEYILKEVETPAGYETASYRFKFDKAQEDAAVPYELINKTAEVTVTKNWVNGDEKNRPDITIYLLQNGEIFKTAILKNGETSYTWSGLPATKGGQDYVYTVDELKLPNYKKTVKGFTITNEYVSPVTSVTVTKKWVNGPSDKPTIEFQLLRSLEGTMEPEKVGNPVALVSGSTTYTWKDVPVTNEKGQAYHYFVNEVNVPANYKATVGADGFTITNTYEIPKTSYTATKKWVDGPATHPTIEVQLYQDGQAYGDPVLLENGTTTYTWGDLDETDINGNQHVYTVDELNTPKNYKKTVQGNTITNTYVIPKTEVTATKQWIKGPETHPTVEFQLFQNGQAYGNPVQLENGTTTYTWKDLDETDQDGNKHIYTVDEVNPPANYKKTVDGLTVTNTYVSPKQDVTVTKVWENGPKPTIDVQLYRDGQAVGDPIQLDGSTTTYTWNALDVTDENGVTYVYTVDEVNTPANYVKSVNGLSITNTYVIPTADVTATKVWVDGPDEHPTIELQLYRDGVAYGEPVQLENGTTTYVWENLDVTDKDGNVYVYTVDERNPPTNYKKTVEGMSVTNTYVIPKTEVTATKIWVDGPANHPTIELQLYQDGQAYGAPVQLVDGVTSYTWADLDETDQYGVKHIYTVDEINTPTNYEKTVDGYSITNTYVIPKIDVTATKVWENAPAKKPTIKLQLFQDGEPYGEVVQLDNGTTSYTWTNLDETDQDGNKHVYTVDEITTPKNYQKVVDGLTITNTYSSPILFPKVDLKSTNEEDVPSIIKVIEEFLEQYDQLTPEEREEVGRFEEVQALKTLLEELKKSQEEKANEQQPTKLPQTNASSYNGLAVIGCFLLAIGAYLISRRRAM